MYNAPTKAKYHYRLIGGDRKPAYLVEVWQGDNTYSEPLRIDFYSADSEGEAQFQTKSVENLEHNVKIMKAIWRAAATANNREFADWHRLTMEDLQKALAHLKAVQVAYDGRISRYVTRETMADCSLSRWMDDYNNIGTGHCTVSVLAANETDAKSAMLLDAAQPRNKTYIMENGWMVKWLQAGQPVMKDFHAYPPTFWEWPKG